MKIFIYLIGLYGLIKTQTQYLTIFWRVNISTFIYINKYINY